MAQLEWQKLLSDSRRKQLARGESSGADPEEFRSEFERDYDRVLFSAPVRRLADKTQVFPMDPSDSVRTRLTHSHEVSALARSLGNALLRRDPLLGEELGGKVDAIPVILATVGLAHDLGNPPFGHQGEKAIQEWVKLKCVNDKKFEDNFKKLSEAQQQDFLRFEGNAQCFRILTRLQIVSDGFGLNLTCATLASLLKYPVGSAGVMEKSVAAKKHGFFEADREAIAAIWQETGLAEYQRHPLAYLMEVADDIAYSVIDVEDAVKKGLVSYPDVIAWLRAEASSAESNPSTALVLRVIELAQKKHEDCKNLSISPSELNELSIQRFRVYAITEMVRACISAFVNERQKIMSGSLQKSLIDVSDASILCASLKKFARRHAYQHRSVLKIELEGHKILHALMDKFWPAIERGGEGGPDIRYVFGRISENYRRIYNDEKDKQPEFYRKMLLLTDMIAGMTDGFATNLCKELEVLV